MTFNSYQYWLCKYMFKKYVLSEKLSCVRDCFMPVFQVVPKYDTIWIQKLTLSIRQCCRPLCSVYRFWPFQKVFVMSKRTNTETVLSCTPIQTYRHDWWLDLPNRRPTKRQAVPLSCLVHWRVRFSVSLGKPLATPVCWLCRLGRPRNIYSRRCELPVYREPFDVKYPSHR